MAEGFYLPVGDYLGSLWPKGLVDLPPMEQIHDIWMEPLNIDQDPGFAIRTALLFKQELALGIPGLNAVQIVFQASSSDRAVMFALDTAPKPIMRVLEVDLALRFSRDLLCPAKRVHGDDGHERIEADPSASQVAIALNRATFALDLEGNLDLGGGAALDLPLCLLGQTGVALQANGIQLFGNRDVPPPGKPAGWRGIFIPSAKLFLPGELASTIGDLSVTNAYIGNGGFSGTVTDVRNPPAQSRLLGMEFKLERVSLSFVQNTLAASALTGQIKIPFFDEWVAVEVGFGLDGAVHLRLSGNLPVLRKSGVLEIHLDSLAFNLSDGRLALSLSGRLTPLVAGLTWPTFDLRELVIDSEGNVHLAGGWLDLGSQFSLDFHGFAIEITRLGFGRNPDGSRWIGFSGGIHLVDGLPAGAAVDGLRVTWRDDGGIALSLEGVAVALEVPGAFSFAGKVSYREPQPGEFRFDGAIRLKLISLEIEVDGLLIVGRRDGTNYFAIYLGVELPAGIPLGPTGVGLYGLAGLFACEMGPNKRPEEGWYQNPGGEDGWYLRPAPGVTDLASKWDAQSGGVAFGAGLTIGTLPDNGFSFSGKVLLAIVFPGPVLLIEGRANILKERSRLSDEPLFRALAVLDGNAGTFTLGLSARFQYLIDDELIDLSGNAEAFFKFNDPGAWHIWIGRKDPRAQRISADIFFRLFGANAYFMLDMHSLQLGAWVGYDRHFEFGPLSIDLESWIEGNAALSIKPVHFHGDLWLHGRFAASAFGIGIGLSMDAKLAADVFTPFYIMGSFDVSLELPWPLPDIGVSVALSWGDKDGPRPPMPLPLKEVTVEHLKSTTRWPLPRDSATPLLVPNYNNGGMIASPAPAFDPNAGPPALEVIPVIPLDPKLGLTFGRHVNDDAGIAAPSQPEVIEQIGNPDTGQGPLKVRYGLKTLQLERWKEGAWTSVAARPAAGGTPQLYGTWATMPNNAQTKLLVYSKSAFDYTRNADEAWNDLALKGWDKYPCQTPPPPKVICFDWRWAALGSTVPMPWNHPKDLRLAFRWLVPGGATPVFVVCPLWDDRGLLLPVMNQQGAFDITLPWPSSRVEALIVTDQVGGEWGILDAFDGNGNSFRAQSDGGHGLRRMHLRAEAPDGRDLVSVRLSWRTPIYLIELCLREGGRRALEDEYSQKNKQVQGELARWSQEDEVLQPNTVYRLKIVTTAEPKAPAAAVMVQTEYALFRTQGPPGLATLAIPIGQPANVPFVSGLDDLTAYVAQTMPITIPPAGERPRRIRPVYRAYDVGVRFNVNYVDMLYRMDGRDLGLYLFDTNNRPARDMAGRLLVFNNPWGKAEDLLLTAGDTSWVQKVQQSDCATIDVSKIARDRLMLASDGHLLAPDAVYEARLVPMLFHEDFTGGLNRWQTVTISGAAANWTATFHPAVSGSSATIAGMAAAQAIVQLDAAADLSKIVAGDDVIRLWDDKIRASKRYRVAAVNAAAHQVTVDGAPMLTGGKSNWEIPAYGGAHQLVASETVLLRGDAGWTDYRFTAYVRLNGSGQVGLVVRWRDGANHARLIFSNLSVKFERVTGGAAQSISEFNLGISGDRLLTIEALGLVLRAYLDGDLLGEITEPTLNAGQVGLYTNLPAGASTRFSDARLDDLRANAPVVYRFNFTTSRFANFYHYLHSYDDSITRQDFPAVAAWQGRGVILNAPGPDEVEARAYRELAEAALGSGANHDPPIVWATRLEANGAAIALLIQSPEPVEWSRASLALLAATPAGLKPVPPGNVKLAEVRFGTAQPNDESITLLAREAVDLGGARVEYRWLPGQKNAPAEPILRVDNFRTDTDVQDVETVLWKPTFADLGEVTVHTQPGVLDGQPQWSAQAGELTQATGTWVRRLGMPPFPDFTRPATWVEAGQATWTDIRVTVRLAAPHGGAVGVLFRFHDADNNYFLILRGVQGQPCNGTLIRSVGGARQALWSSTLLLSLDVGRLLIIESRGSLLRAELDGTQLFSITDASLFSGKVGLATNGAPGATFADVQVDGFARRLSDWTVNDDTGLNGPSQWAIENGALCQHSAVGANTPGNPGTFITAGETSWIDYRFEVYLRSDAPGAVGVIFRYTDPTNYYRFSVDNIGGYRRLVSVTNGVTTTLWEVLGPNAYPQGNAFRLAVEAIGPHLLGTIDGVQSFVVTDAAHPAGKVGLYCSANPGMLVFEDEVRFVEPQWQPYYTFAVGEKLPSGRKLRLFAGNATQAPAPQTGTIDRFVAHGADSGQLRLPQEGVDLQLVLTDKAGVPESMSVAHKRRFLPDSAYAPVDARILRKVDGTAWALFPVPGMPAFLPGEYRLRITFRRDNQAVVKDSPIYSQADDRADETVTLDLPWEF